MNSQGRRNDAGSMRHGHILRYFLKTGGRRNDVVSLRLWFEQVLMHLSGFLHPRRSDLHLTDIGASYVRHLYMSDVSHLPLR